MQQQAITRQAYDLIKDVPYSNYKLFPSVVTKEFAELAAAKIISFKRIDNQLYWFRPLEFDIID
jgi:hypothetical protein